MPNCIEGGYGDEGGEGRSQPRGAQAQGGREYSSTT